MRPKILLFYHCGSNTGYAIETLEQVFLEMALRFTGDIERIHIGYRDYDAGPPKYLPKEFTRLLAMDTKDPARENVTRIRDYISDNGINVAFGFDQPVAAPAYAAMREAGIRLFVSYLGAPVSSRNAGLKLMLKKMEVKLRRHKPDHYIFESQAMADTAVFGRGISPESTSVIPLGVETERFKPDPALSGYAHATFGIPKERKIVVYSGHMEERKGVRVIIGAANKLVCEEKRTDLHFLLLGNRHNESKAFDSLYQGTASEPFITFGGYRDDIKKIFCSCFLGLIASTGWDSFTMSSLEMAASGLPLVVSDLHGLREAIEPDLTGLLFPPGQHCALASRIKELVDNPSRYHQMKNAGRERVIRLFSQQHQVERLSQLLRELFEARGGNR